VSGSRGRIVPNFVETGSKCGKVPSRSILPNPGRTNESVEGTGLLSASVMSLEC